jgi:hypothetical protein
MIPLFNSLKSPVGVHVHKTTYGPLIDTARTRTYFSSTITVHGNTFLNSVLIVSFFII